MSPSKREVTSSRCRGSCFRLLPCSTLFPRDERASFALSTFQTLPQRPEGGISVRSFVTGQFGRDFFLESGFVRFCSRPFCHPASSLPFAQHNLPTIRCWSVSLQSSREVGAVSTTPKSGFPLVDDECRNFHVSRMVRREDRGNASEAPLDEDITWRKAKGLCHGGIGTGELD
jgi:hypothetical protein